MALLAGLPLGTAGRWAWAVFAGSVGAGPSTTVPLGALALTVPIALLLANIIAVGPDGQRPGSSLPSRCETNDKQAAAPG